MNPRRLAAPQGAALVRTEVFKALDHYLVITSLVDGLWTLSVDGKPVLQAFGTRAEAWEAGVRAIDIQDRQRPRSVG
jgi:hypothetical protein